MTTTFSSPFQAIEFIYGHGDGPLPFRVGFPNGIRKATMWEYQKICENIFGASALELVSVTGGPKFIYNPEGCWAAPANLFYFREEEDAVAFRLCIG
jgi:hypothetical protein